MSAFAGIHPANIAAFGVEGEGFARVNTAWTRDRLKRALCVLGIALEARG